MIKGIGVDIVELDRIHKDSIALAHRILSKNEFKQYEKKKTIKQKQEYLAGRFAGKEAFLKAFGKGLGEIPLKEIEILNDFSGKPYFSFSSHCFISISHENKYAIAYVVIEEG